MRVTKKLSLGTSSPLKVLFVLVLVLVGVGVASACGPTAEGSGSSAASKPGEVSAGAPAEAPSADSAGESAAGEGDAAAAQADAEPASGTAGKLLRWLDPESVGATWVGRAHDLDADALATLYAIPPRAARMLRDIQFVDEGLRIALGAEEAKEWLRPEVLAMQPAVARGTYVLRLLAAPRSKVEEALVEYEMTESKVEGFSLWEPDGVFPWRILFLDDETLAMIPTQEMGSGIGPLTAGRDLPASMLEKELNQAIAAEPNLVLDLFAQGPFLHMDLSEDVAVVRLSLRQWQGSGLDGNVLLQPLGDPATAADELEARDGAVENDAMRELIDRIAFSAEPPVVLGRLQIPAEDRGPLRRL